METDTTRIRHNLEIIREKIANAARGAGRDPEKVRLLAVSKMQPVELIEAAAAASQVDFGENYAQELRDKSGLVNAPVTWHFIGPLQQNKVNMVVGKAGWIHSVCRPGILQAIERRAAGLGIVQQVLVQVNTGAEPQKNGLAPEELSGFLDLFTDTHHVRCCGLMTLPPFDLDAEAVRPHFVQLAGLLREHRDNRPPNVCLTELSMGMSSDFEVAVAEGATWVRVGSALFGPREGNA